MFPKSHTTCLAGIHLRFLIHIT